MRWLLQIALLVLLVNPAEILRSSCCSKPCAHCVDAATNNTAYLAESVLLPSSPPAADAAFVPPYSDAGPLAAEFVSFAGSVDLCVRNHQFLI